MLQIPPIHPTRSEAVRLACLKFLGRTSLKSSLPFEWDVLKPKADVVLARSNMAYTAESFSPKMWWSAHRHDARLILTESGMYALMIVKVGGSWANVGSSCAVLTHRRIRGMILFNQSYESLSRAQITTVAEDVL